MKAVIPFDGSDNSARAFGAVRNLLALQPAVEIHLLSVLDAHSVKGSAEHVIQEPPTSSFGKVSVTTPFPRIVESHGQALERVEGEKKDELEDLARKEIPGATFEGHVVWSNHPADAIVQFADEIDADVIVMATHGRSGVSHFLAGSVTEHVIRAAKKLVLVQGPTVP
ncbi:MAG: universal stress protein [Dehalococcoidia bacterium]